MGARRPNDTVKWGRAADAALPDRVTSLTVAMDHAPPGGLELWTHRLGLDGISRPLAVTGSVRGPSGPTPLALEDGRVAVPLEDRPWTVELDLEPRQARITDDVVE